MAEDGWRLIDTAPRDGTDFLVHLVNGWITRGRFVGGRYFASDSSGPTHRGSDPNPTHWMPLPPPPTPAPDPLAEK